MNRKLTIQSIEEILYNRIKNDQFTTLQSLPKPENFKDIDKATQRILLAIQNNETINLVGDYDADGVTSTAIISSFFKALGVPLHSIIPNRFKHGYGLSPKILEQIDEGIIITVDNGISAVEAALLCKERGLDLIITDHHTVGDVLPDAFAIINPKQHDCSFPFKEICGAQVAWYLCASLKKALQIEYNLMQLFDILSIAIIADIMPMVSLNRTMVKAGLQALATSSRPALSVFRKRYDLTIITEEDIGFKLAPLINCAGRMEDPSIALDFLLAENEFEANKQLDILIRLNDARKEDQLKIFEEAKAQVHPNDKVVLVKSASWNEGIIGIVASKLCEKYKKPAIVCSVDTQKGIAKGSCRSTSEINLYELIKSCSDLLNGFGGHKQAAGLSLQNAYFDDFKVALNRNILLMEHLGEDTNSLTLGDFSVTDVSFGVYNLIESFRPFGITNPYPILTFRSVEVLSVVKMGKNKEFTKLIVSDAMDKRTTIEVVIFVDFADVTVGEKISFTATIAKNEFRGEVKLNLMFKELISLDPLANSYKSL